MTTTNIETIRDDSVFPAGTGLQGYVETTYDHLVATFGEPTYDVASGDGKVQYEWVLRTPAGIATVYDWKNYGRDAKTVTNWHIGGHSEVVVPLVQSAINNKANRSLAMDAVNDAVRQVDRGFYNGWPTDEELDTLWEALDTERRSR